MQQPGDLANILAVVGFFILLVGTISYGGQIFGKLTGTQDSVFIGAAGCTGLTGATLAACQKAQPKPKPKPQGITPAPKRGITPARKGITPAKPKPKQASIPVKIPYAQKVCTDKGGTWRTGKCFMPITAPSPIVLALNTCIKKVTQYTETQKKLALDRLAAQYGYTGLNPGQQLLDNNAQSGGYQAKLLRNKYNNLRDDLVRQCEKRYLGLDVIGAQNRGENVPRLIEPGQTHSV